MDPERLVGQVVECVDESIKGKMLLLLLLQMMVMMLLVKISIYINISHQISFRRIFLT